MQIPKIPQEISLRTQGQYPLAIGTSMGLEGIFGIHEGITYSKADPKPFKNFHALVVNIRTLIRNIFSAIDAQYTYGIEEMVMLMLVIEEMNTLREVVADNTRNKLKVYFYTCTYEDLPAKYPHAKLKLPTTTKQTFYDKLERSVIEKLNFYYNSGELVHHFTIRDSWFRLNIDKSKIDIHGLNTHLPRTLMLTHLPLDIITSKIRKLFLLESHTGKIKGEPYFNTKLKGKPDCIPFNKMSIQVYGDTGDTFAPLDNKLRKELTALAKTKGWNSTTTVSKLRSDIKDSKVTELITRVLPLLK